MSAVVMSLLRIKKEIKDTNGKEEIKRKVQRKEGKSKKRKKKLCTLQ